MNSESKTCANCKQLFTIEPTDFDFYSKINVPPPTQCPTCRQRRRYAWRNERVLYRRDCDLCGKSTVTIYSPNQNKPFKVYCPTCWWLDKWTALDYGREFDFSKPFFPQWRELQLQVPRIALLTKNSVNSEYTNHGGNNKNCYLSVSVFGSENIMYSQNLWRGAHDCCDCTLVSEGGTLLYESVDLERCYKCQFSSFLRDCSDCYYCYDCRGSQNCFLSCNLRNKQYYIFNKQYGKEEYEKKIAEWSLDSAATRAKLREQYRAMVKNAAMHRAVEIERSVNVSGSMMFNCKNVQNSFDVYDVEDSKNLVVATDAKDCMDVYHFGFKTELSYESHALNHGYQVLFTHLIYEGSYITYSDSCHNSQNLFGCVGIRHGKYLILNKQYSEEEYNILKDKIIAHMRETKEFGEFFPPSLSPFGYNETQGQIYMPLTKEKALAMGYQWEEQLPGVFGKETIQSKNLPDSITEITDSILTEVLVCVLCKQNYKIVQSELDFYKSQNIPLPRHCPDCRYKARIAQRPPRHIQQGKCQCAIGAHSHGQTVCPNTFETPFTEKEVKKIFCESCYQAEIV